MKKRFRGAPKRAAAPKTEERPASDAVAALTRQAIADINRQIEGLGILALRDAKLSAEDGWRYDVRRCVYVRQT